jgi:hypothetical protein
MKTLDLTPYDVEVRGPEGSRTLPYDLVESVLGLLFHAELKLSARELLGRQGLGEKLAAGGVVSLEDAEHAIVVRAVENFRGFGKSDTEFVRRVLEA